MNTMDRPVIRVNSLSKKYVLGSEMDRNDTFREMLVNLARSPFQRFRRLQGVSPEQQEFWALKDVSFEVKAGEVIGIIGANGAGKSTLLKILSRITAPTKGEIEYRGRIASILEVGTGFHPELSGRENIFINGAILGMNKAEIRERFDDIVDFSGIEKFLDTPVKRYSSGMYVRLAFAVIAYLDPDILIVDEVLAVGDLAFQKRCLGKMQDVARGGRSVLFVSHNLSAIRNLCPSVLLLENGQLKFHGPTEKGLEIYEKGLINTDATLANRQFQGPLSDQIKFVELSYSQNRAKVTVLDTQQDFEIELIGLALRDFSTLELKIAIFSDGYHLTSCFDTPQEAIMHAGQFISRFHIPANVLKPGIYTIGIGAVTSNGQWVWGQDVAALNFSEIASGPSLDRNKGAITLPYTAERIQ